MRRQNNAAHQGTSYPGMVRNSTAQEGNAYGAMGDRGALFY
jgi:hypothetical protein